MRFLFFFLFCSSVRGQSLDQIRLWYSKSSTDYVAYQRLSSELKLVESSPLYTGYSGVVLMLGAKWVNNPFTKLKVFIKGRDLLEQSIHIDPYNPELRYLRLTIQENSPRFLGYYSNINQDRNFLSTCIINDQVLKKMVISYLK